MKQGQENFEKLWEKLQAERAGARDYIANTRKLKFETKEEGGGNSTLFMEEAPNTFSSFGVSELAHRQLADRLKIPFKYYEQMRTKQPALLDINVNTWLHEQPENRMIRTLFGNVRAFLSDRYQRIDNLELAYRIVKVMGENQHWAVGSCEVTDTRLYVKVVSDKLKTEVVPGDVVQAGFVVSNSEVGLGSVKIEPLVYRLVCKNGLIVQDRVHQRYHVGQRCVEGEYGQELYREETIKTDQKAYFMKVEDILRGALDRELFENTVERMRAAKTKRLDADPVEAVKLLGEAYKFTEAETMQVGAHFLQENDYSHYGLVNAVTRTSQDIEDYNRATEFEKFGGQLLNGGIDFIVRNISARKVG